MKDYKNKIDSGNGRMKTKATRKRDYRVNPKAIARLSKNLKATGYGHASNQEIIKGFIRRAKKGVL